MQQIEILKTRNGLFIIFHVVVKDSYYGETKHKLSTRSRKHELACKQAKQTGIVRKNGCNDAGMATHCLSCFKSFNFSEIEILEHQKTQTNDNI